MDDGFVRVKRDADGRGRWYVWYDGEGGIFGEENPSCFG